jgi:chaperonin GroES
VPRSGRRAGQAFGGLTGRRRTRAVRYRATVPPSAKSSPARSSASKQPITMLSDRVLVLQPQSEGERRSRSGILIPATAQVSRRLAWAEVVAIGPHVRSIKVGDKVLFNPEDRLEVEVKGDEFVILRERDVHAVATERLDSGTGLYL